MNVDQTEGSSAQLRREQERLRRQIQRIEILVKQSESRTPPLRLLKDTRWALFGFGLLLLSGLFLGRNRMLFLSLLGLGSIGLYVLYNYYSCCMKPDDRAGPIGINPVEVELGQLRNRLIEIERQIAHKPGR